MTLQELVKKMTIVKTGIVCWFMRNINKVSGMSLGTPKIYINSDKVSPALGEQYEGILLHETVHYVQCKTIGRFLFVLKYIFVPSFRYKVESEAYIEELLFYIKDQFNTANLSMLNYLHKVIPDRATKIATVLSGRIYLYCVKKEFAAKDIEERFYTTLKLRQDGVDYINPNIEFDL